MSSTDDEESHDPPWICLENLKTAIKDELVLAGGELPCIIAEWLSYQDDGDNRGRFLRTYILRQLSASLLEDNGIYYMCP